MKNRVRKPNEQVEENISSKIDEIIKANTPEKMSMRDWFSLGTTKGKT